MYLERHCGAVVDAVSLQCFGGFWWLVGFLLPSKDMQANVIPVSVWMSRANLPLAPCQLRLASAPPAISVLSWWMDNYVFNFELFGLPYRPVSRPQNADTSCLQKSLRDCREEWLISSVLWTGNLPIRKFDPWPAKKSPSHSHNLCLRNTRSCYSQIDLNPLACSHWNSIWAVIGGRKHFITFPMDS